MYEDRVLKPTEPESKPVAEIRRLNTKIDSPDPRLRSAIDIRERLVALEAKARP